MSSNPSLVTSTGSFAEAQTQRRLAGLGRLTPRPGLDRRAKLDRPKYMRSLADIGLSGWQRSSDPKPLQGFAFFDSKLIRLLPAAFSFAFNACSSAVLSAPHFCSDASSIPLSLV